MNKILFSIIVTLLFITNSYSQVKNDTIADNKVLWIKSKKLTWDDFKGTPPDSLYAVVAGIQGSIEIVNITLENDIPKLTVHSYCIKNESWSILFDDATLAHEQLHFNIYELYARKIRKAFAELNKKRVTDINEYQKAYELYVYECMDFNKLYDREVYFNDKRQQEWIRKIAVELRKLQKYELVQ